MDVAHVSWGYCVLGLGGFGLGLDAAASARRDTFMPERAHHEK